MRMCRAISCVVGRGCLLRPVHPLGKTVSLCLVSFCTPGQTYLLLQVSLTSYFCIPVHYDEKDVFFCVSILEGLEIFTEPFNFSFFSISDWGIDLDYCDIQCFALETNRNHSVILEIAPKYCILDSFVDYDGYFISSKGFLPTVVDIMVIWIKFAHSCPS